LSPEVGDDKMPQAAIKLFFLGEQLEPVTVDLPSFDSAVEDHEVHDEHTEAVDEGRAVRYADGSVLYLPPRTEEGAAAA